MTHHKKAIIFTLFAVAVINLLGVLFFFAPIAKADTSASELVPAGVGFLVYVILIVALFDWTAIQTQSSWKAALIIGLSQFLLVNVDYVLSGKRGLVTAGASTVLMIVTWMCAAFVHSRFMRTTEKAADA